MIYQNAVAWYTTDGMSEYPKYCMSAISQSTMQLPCDTHIFCKGWHRFWTHRDFGEHIEKQGEHGEVDTDPLPTKSFLQVLWHGHDLQIKRIKGHKNDNAKIKWSAD